MTHQDLTPFPRLTGDQILQLVQASDRAEKPPCFVCGQAVADQTFTLGAAAEEDRVLVNAPCGHRMTYNVNVAHQKAAEARQAAVQAAATEATEPGSGFFQRLTELSQLCDGWLDGQGQAPSPEVIKAAAVLGPALPSGITPHVYPTAPGGVQMEWDDEHGQHHLEILPDARLFLQTVGHDEHDELEALRAELDDQRKARATAAGAADRFRDVLCEAFGFTDDNPGDDVLVARLREHFGKTGPEPTAWRDRLAGYEALRDQINAAARDRREGR